MHPEITFAATGDSYITRRLPAEDVAHFQAIAKILQGANVRFTNLETTTHHFEGTPSALCGGQWAMASPDVLQDLKAYGFNMVAWANNHTMDYLYDGLEATEKYLNQYGFVHAGAGQNLARASEPRYLETTSGRVALIAVTSTFHEFQMAGEQRPDMIGRPGVNPLRYTETYMISGEQMSQLKSIADSTYINAKNNMRVKNGYEIAASNDLFMFGSHRFQVGMPAGVTTIPLERDMKRILNKISEAKRQADYVIVSIHAHEMKEDKWEIPADFITAFSKKCIDEGAHAIIGHGPHILRGIEIYKGRPIFYSLGNFIFQNETLTHVPADCYEKYGLNHSHNVADALDAKSADNTRGYSLIPEVWQTVIPFWTMENGVLKELTLYPVELGFEKKRSQRGCPALSDDILILKRLQELSAPFGTDIQIEGTVGKVTILS